MSCPALAIAPLIQTAAHRATRGGTSNLGVAVNVDTSDGLTLTICADAVHKGINCLPYRKSGTVSWCFYCNAKYVYTQLASDRFRHG